MVGTSDISLQHEHYTQCVCIRGVHEYERRAWTVHGQCMDSAWTVHGHAYVCFRCVDVTGACTQDEGVDNNSRYGGAHHEAQHRIDGEVGSEGNGHAEHGL